MKRPQQCATVRTQGDAQPHNSPNTRTTQRTDGQPPSLKALAGAVLGRTTPRTMDAHCAQSSCTSSVEDRRAGDGGHQAIDADLERLIQDAADFWQYDADDLRLIRSTAAADPDGLRRALSTDPLKPFYAFGLDSLFDDASRAIRDSERKHHAND